MATNKLTKEQIVVADIEFGMGIVTDSRGQQNQVNANNLPYTDTQSNKQALDGRYTKADSCFMPGWQKGKTSTCIRKKAEQYS